MSIVAVHGPYTFGSKDVWNSTKTFHGFAITSNGLTWRFYPADQSQVAANYDWTWAEGTGTTGGSPASLPNTMVGAFTFPVGPSTKVITLTLNSVVQPTITITIPGATGGASPMMVGEGDGEDEITQETPVQETPEVQVGYDPAAHTVSEVQEYVTEHPDQAGDVYDAELVGKSRTTLVNWLEEQIPYDPGDYTVQEVVDYAEANTDQLEDIIAAEQDGKNRSTLVAQLEALRS